MILPTPLPPPPTLTQTRQIPRHHFLSMIMSHMGYRGSFGRRRRLSSPPSSSRCRCRCSRGIRFSLRLRCGKSFSVKRLRVRFMSIFRGLEWLRRQYGRALRLFRCNGGGKKSGEGYFGSLVRNGSSRVWLVQRDVPHSQMTNAKTCGCRNVARSSTFHAEAIEDCLEFIKGTYSTASVVGHGDNRDDQSLRQSTEDDSMKM